MNAGGHRTRAAGWGGLKIVLLWLVGAAATLIAGPAVLFESAPGQVQVAATDAAAAEPVLTAAQSAWRALAEPLELPEAFSSPVFVRVVPPTEWTQRAPFHVVVEAGGVVTLWLRGGDTAPDFLRRGLVQALLLRKGVELHGVSARLAVPLWLEVASVAAWQVEENGAWLDGLQRRAVDLPVPALGAILGRARGEEEPPEFETGAYWLWVFLQAESPGRNEWRRMLALTLGGVDSMQALAGTYPSAAGSEAERELWWRIGWHHHRRVPVLPLLSIADSRAAVADAVRQVWLRDGTEAEIGVEEWRGLGRAEPGRSALRREAARVEALAPRLHVFYRNAAVSLGRLLVAATQTDAAQFGVARAQFERDWRDASELEAASARALDSLEAR